jgi:hypothetical protein
VKVSSEVETFLTFLYPYLRLSRTENFPSNNYIQFKEKRTKEFDMGYMLYRAIGLVLDFIHRLVCGRQKIPQRFGDWIFLRPQVAGAE